MTDSNDSRPAAAADRDTAPAHVLPEAVAPVPVWPSLSARGLAVVYLLICLLPVGLAIGARTVPLDPWEALGAGLGLAGLMAMVVQMVTSGRFRRVSGRMGIDRIMAFHKLAAWWVLLVLMLHPLAYVLPTFLDDPARGMERLLAYHLLPAYRSGVIALSALVLLVLAGAARAVFRYELWRGSHVLLALVALGGGLHHALSAGRLSSMGPLAWLWWAAAGVVVLVPLILHGWRWWRLRRRPWRLARITPVAARIWELELAPGSGSPPLRYHAGQFIWLTEGGWRCPLGDHPFSIAGTARAPGLRLIIKEAGDFTRRIGQLAPGSVMGVDGPYGTFTLERHGGEAVVLIAGGVGIAPVMSLLRDLVARRDPRPVRLAYAAGQPENFACLDEIRAAQAVLDLRVLLISETGGPDWTGEIGMLDAARLDGLLEGLDVRRAVALICGPGPMVTAVSDGLLDLGLPMGQVVYERFDYGGAFAGRQDRRRSLRFMALLAVVTAGLALLSRLF